MVTVPKGTRLEFTAKREIDGRSFTKLISHAGRLGLYTEFAPEQDLPQDPEQILRSHLEATPITGPDSYLGKEHFWMVGEKVGVSRLMATKLFHVLIDLQGFRPHYSFPFDEFDIRTTLRDEVGMPYPTHIAGLRGPSQVTRDRFLGPRSDGLRSSSRWSYRCV
ncbi:MAG TPA: hypothetical protein VMR34_02835 [Candidatus Saccharimonadales bacterium]|nr:hypothetical protein [Candidatus Saccharimonadales bacterium]